MSVIQRFCIIQVHNYDNNTLGKKFALDDKLSNLHMIRNITSYYV